MQIISRSLDSTNFYFIESLTIFSFASKILTAKSFLIVTDNLINSFKAVLLIIISYDPCKRWLIPKRSRASSRGDIPKNKSFFTFLKVLRSLHFSLCCHRRFHMKFQRKNDFRVRFWRESNLGMCIGVSGVLEKFPSVNFPVISLLKSSRTPIDRLASLSPLNFTFFHWFLVFHPSSTFSSKWPRLFWEDSSPNEARHQHHRSFTNYT